MSATHVDFRIGSQRESSQLGVFLVNGLNNNSSLLAPELQCELLGEWRNACDEL